MYPVESRHTDDQFQFHTRNPVLISSVCSHAIFSVKGEKENDRKAASWHPFSTHSPTGKTDRSTDTARASTGLTSAIKKCDGRLFILPYTLPCDPPGGKVCCFSASAAWAQDCLQQHSGTWLCWRQAQHEASSPSSLMRSNTEHLQTKENYGSVFGNSSACFIVEPQTPKAPPLCNTDQVTRGLNNTTQGTHS